MRRVIGYFVLLLLASCGTPEGDRVASDGGSAQLSAPTPTVSDALRQDAQTFASSMNISLDDAINRLQLQDEIGALQEQLATNEADTFAGMWIQHEPQYRVVVTFTRDGEQTIQPYIAGTPLADVIEVRTAQVTEQQLRDAQQATIELLDELGLPFSSGINIQESKVELYITDRQLFDQKMTEAGASLPPLVEPITTYEPLREPPPNVTPAPEAVLPQLRVTSGAFMLALFEGELIVENGCLRVQPDGSDTSHLVIWQPDYFASNNNGAIEIVDRDGAVVGRVGEQINMSGGEVSSLDERQLRDRLPANCSGPYWLAGNEIELR